MLDLPTRRSKSAAECTRSGTRRPDSSCCQLPHRTVSARRSHRTRFFCPQLPQVTTRPRSSDTRVISRLYDQPYGVVFFVVDLAAGLGGDLAADFFAGAF